MGFCLLSLTGAVIFHSALATGDIYALDSYAIYEGLLAPENIIGTNLQVLKLHINLFFVDILTISTFQNLINFLASVVGWALLVPLWQPQEKVQDRSI